MHRDWLRLAEQELKGVDPIDLLWRTPEGIAVKPFYTIDDLPPENTEAIAGVAPFKRGIRATMYTGKPWTIRQYAGFSTAKESNLFYRKNLADGQMGLSVAFDLATHRGYDSDHPRVRGDVGKAGVAIDSVEDMKILFDGIPLDKMSVSMTMNGAVIPTLAMFIVAGQEQGLSQNQLSGTIQNDILKEFMVRNTYIYPPQASMRIVADIIAYCSKNLPRFNSISISGYHMQEAGATLVQELAYTLADGMEYVRAALSHGLDIEEFAGRLSFFFCIGMNVFMEAAKLRAARQIWAQIMTNLGARSDRSRMLRTHCQTSGVSLTEQDPYNNIVRTTCEAMAAILGGTQSLHTNAYDEAIALPTKASARIARNTQLILQHETGLANVVDPLGGSYYVEALTEELTREAWRLIEEVEAVGGMTAAVATGLPKQRIEEAAIRRQARIDNGSDVIVGVNKFTQDEQENIDILTIDNAQVYAAQVSQLESVRKTRNESACQAALQDLTKVAEDGKGSLLESAISAARHRATLGEISSAMEAVFGRHLDSVTVVSNVYEQENRRDSEYKATKRRVQDIKNLRGKTPHILVSKVGQDGHDRGARVIASAFSDMGFDVSVSDMFATPKEVVAMAIDKHVDLIGLSTLTAAHKTLVPEIINLLRQHNRQDIFVICGGVIPEQDYQDLYDVGVAEIFGPGTHVITAANTILGRLAGVLSNRPKQ